MGVGFFYNLEKRKVNMIGSSLAGLSFFAKNSEAIGAAVGNPSGYKRNLAIKKKRDDLRADRRQKILDRNNK